MKFTTLRARVTLWSVSVVTMALAFFAGAAAWSLKLELIENLDKNIRAEARDFFIALKRQPVDWRNGRSVEALFAQSKQLRYIEVRDHTGQLLYRSPAFNNAPAFVMPEGIKPRNIAWNGRTLHIGVFHQDGISVGIGANTDEIN